MADTQTIAGVPVEIPVRMKPEEIFDAIMGRIEPELTHAQVRTLKEKYANEAPEQKQARAARYKKAFEEFDRQYAEYDRAMDALSRSQHLAAMRTVELNHRAADESKLQEIESTISSSD